MSLSMSEDAVQARSEAARHAITTRWARTTPEERKRATRKMRLSSAVSTICDAGRNDELSEDQIDRLVEAVFELRRDAA